VGISSKREQIIIGIRKSKRGDGREDQGMKSQCEVTDGGHGNTLLTP
jgi:hypothetical protein